MARKAKEVAPRIVNEDIEYDDPDKKPVEPVKPVKQAENFDQYRERH